MKTNTGPYFPRFYEVDARDDFGTSEPYRSLINFDHVTTIFPARNGKPYTVVQLDTPEVYILVDMPYEEFIRRLPIPRRTELVKPNLHVEQQG